MNAYSPKDYWNKLAEDYAQVDKRGFAPVVHPVAPFWFNELIDELQFRAIRRALSLAKLSRGSHVLDVGCGIRRWVRRHEQMGFLATGFGRDAEYARYSAQARHDIPL